MPLFGKKHFHPFLLNVFKMNNTDNFGDKLNENFM